MNELGTNNIIKQIETWSESQKKKVSSKEFWLNRDSYIYALFALWFTRNKVWTGVFWIAGQFIKIEDIMNFFGFIESKTTKK